jgi:hypothetical protein
MIEALPPLLAQEPLQEHFQVGLALEIVEKFWLKLTPMAVLPTSLSLDNLNTK